MTIHIDDEPATKKPERITHVKFLARLIRDIFIIPRDRQPCAVCNRYQTITEAHHVIPVNEVAKLCARVGITLDQFEHLPIRFIWLCPNHHTLFHDIHDKSTKRALEIINDIGKDEYLELKTIWDSQNHDELLQFLLKCQEENFDYDDV